jgi:hypothetical protein
MSKETLSEEKRVTSIRTLLNAPIEQTAPSNHARGWRGDCDYLLTELDEKSAQLTECSPYLRNLARQCEACEGSNEIVTGPSDEEATGEPCAHCKPIWDLIERIEPKPQPAQVEAVEEEENDIPF